MKKITLLGSTGSIGQQTLDVISEHPEEFQLVSLSFGGNLELGSKAIKKYKPKFVAVKDKETFSAIQELCKEVEGVTYSYGEEGLIEAAVYHDADLVVNAVIGSVGLVPTLKAIQAGKTIALANKETLVTAGHLVMEEAEKHGVDILPVDSEHSAIFQCLQGENKKEISKLIVTASGGSFRDRSRDELNDVTVKEALHHPNWSMGAKITIDSATMMNKGLEVIEAHWLFGLPYERIEVLLHRQSIIHSMVEYHDRSVMAQLGTPDMRVPIQYAMSYPGRLPLPSASSLQLWEIGELHFEKADFNRYRCLQFAYDSGKIGGTMPTVLNAANEEAVAAFLNGKITFLQIEDWVEKALEQHKAVSRPDLETIHKVDLETRRFVGSLLS
ncbi:1-deoxy-D-xylulose-5-phosphate reductoisomerase [Bacillus lacus]|uniref:1-deoxy-D-xylulose 5-phosphate reductoisomerase n=1 Tax=Metabacillus lacus TaxID=1983721 RepID=A0A7X2LWV5_9BACI|nr:1-deoxy-D-xylulose-5-phosphate reductoisomerase [Metabacillus lacus]